MLGVATDDGFSVMRPSGDATSYSLLSKGLLNRKCPCAIKAGDGKLIVGTEDFFIQTSPDGMEWKASMEGLKRPHITAVARHPKHTNIIFAGTSPPAVYMSSDLGKTWNSLTPLESLPSAERWSYPVAPYRAQVTGLAAHAEYNGVVFASIKSGGLVASKDGGKTWANRDAGLPPTINCLLLPPGGGRRMYVGTDSGFFRSDDLAGTWKDCSKGLPFTRILAMTVAQSNPNILVMSVAKEDTGPSALVLTKDGGDTWTTCSEGLPRLDDRRVTCLTFGKGGFYAGTDLGGLFLLDNMDGRWTRLVANLSPIRDLVALA